MQGEINATIEVLKERRDKLDKQVYESRKHHLRELLALIIKLKGNQCYSIPIVRITGKLASQYSEIRVMNQYQTPHIKLVPKDPGIKEKHSGEWTMDVSSEHYSEVVYLINENLDKMLARYRKPYEEGLEAMEKLKKLK